MYTPIWEKFIEQHGILAASRPVADAFNSYKITTDLKCDILAPLTHLGFIAISGPDASKFLQGQLTCNVQEVTATQTRLGAHCNPKGRVLTFFRLFQIENNYYLQLPLEILASTLTYLKKYAIFSKVTLEDASDRLISIGVAGPTITTLLPSIIQAIPNNLDQAATFEQVLITRVFDSQPRYEMIGDFTAINSMWEKLSQSFPIALNSAWQLLAIAAGIPTIHARTTGLFTPHNLNLQLINAVNFTKGCYTGQEIVARMHYLGKLKQHMYRAWLNSQTAPQPGDNIVAKSNLEAAVGNIVTVSDKVNDGYMLLATLNNSAVNADELYVTLDQQRSIEILPLPYSFNEQ